MYINGFLSSPVATIRELLVSRGGTVEAYNTSRCTHMICESLPAAKIRELRKVRRVMLVLLAGASYYVYDKNTHD